jgi:hypothetical protein
VLLVAGRSGSSSSTDFQIEGDECCLVLVVRFEPLRHQWKDRLHAGGLVLLVALDETHLFFIFDLLSSTNAKEAILICLMSMAKGGILMLPLAIECYKFIMHYAEKAGRLDIS